MRAIKSLQDVQIVLKQLLDWQSNKESKDWDFKGLRIKNASPSKDPSDYVVRSELHPDALAAPPVTSAPQTPAQVNNPAPPAKSDSVDQYYSIVFAVDAAVDGYETPPFWGGINRDGVFIDVLFGCNTAPDAAPASVNFRVNGSDLLTEDIAIPTGETGPFHSSKYVSPLPVMGLDTKVTMKVNVVSGMASFTGEIIVRRNKNPRT